MSRHEGACTYIKGASASAPLPLPPLGVGLQCLRHSQSLRRAICVEMHAPRLLADRSSPISSGICSRSSASSASAQTAKPAVSRVVADGSQPQPASG